MTAFVDSDYSFGLLGNKNDLPNHGSNCSLYRGFLLHGGDYPIIDIIDINYANITALKPFVFYTNYLLISANQILRKLVRTLADCDYKNMVKALERQALLRAWCFRVSAWVSFW